MTVDILWKHKGEKYYREYDVLFDDIKLTDFIHSVIQAIEAEMITDYGAMILPSFYPNYGCSIPAYIGSNLTKDDFIDIENEALDVMSRYKKYLEGYGVDEITYDTRNATLTVNCYIIIAKNKEEFKVVFIKGVWEDNNRS